MTKKENQTNQSHLPVYQYYIGYYNGISDMFKMLFKDKAFEEDWIIFNLRCHLEEKYSAAFKGFESERRVKD